MSAIAPSRQELIEIDEEFRRLHREHQEQEDRLQSIVAKGLRSESDESEIKKIKLRKLALRDRMEAIRRRHAGAAGAATS